MNKTELESKHLGELHSLAAEAGVERYRMLPRAELIEKLADGSQGESKSRPERRSDSPRRSRGGRDEKPRGGRQRKPRAPRDEKSRGPRRDGRQAEPEAESRPQPERPIAPATTPATTPPPPSGRPKRKRRRRWGRRGRSKSVRLQDLLLPAAPGRQAIVYAESREGCTTLLRGLAAELSGASDGPDPIALLIDPTPEELADWRRDAPQAEIVAAGQARHADDALAQAARRAGSGEDVILLIDSLSRFAESYGDTDGAKQLFDAGREAASAGGGSLTVVAAIERS